MFWVVAQDDAQKFELKFITVNGGLDQEEEIVIVKEEEDKKEEEKEEEDLEHFLDQPLEKKVVISTGDVLDDFLNDI